MVICVCKNTDYDDEDTHNYLFDVFSKQQVYIKKQAIKDFVEIFGLPLKTFGNVSKVSRETFLKVLEQKTPNLAPLHEI